MKYLILICVCSAVTTVLADSFNRDWAQFEKDFEHLNQRHAARRANSNASAPDNSAAVIQGPLSDESAPQERADQHLLESNSEESAPQAKEAP